MDIAAALGLASQSIALAKEFQSVEREFDKASLKMKVAELTDNLVELKLALVQAKEELVEREKRISDLKKVLELIPEMVEYDGFRYRKGADGKPTGHPYCPRCLSVDGRTILTVQAQSLLESTCPQCKHTYHQVSSTAWEDTRLERDRVRSLGGDPDYI